MNNVREYTLLDKRFAKFYGFTQAEVDDLLTKVPLGTNPEEIKDWYKGYSFGGEIIYNPWSIMQCLAHEGSLDTYWVDSGGLSLVDEAFIADEIQEDLQNLLEGKSIVKKLYKQVSLGKSDSHMLNVIDQLGKAVGGEEIIKLARSNSLINFQLVHQIIEYVRVIRDNGFDEYVMIF